MEQEKKELTPNLWDQMTVDQLITQKGLMIDRYEFLAARGYEMPASQMLEGIAKLDSLISSR